MHASRLAASTSASRCGRGSIASSARCRRRLTISRAAAASVAAASVAAASAAAARCRRRLTISRAAAAAKPAALARCPPHERHQL